MAGPRRPAVADHIAAPVAGRRATRAAQARPGEAGRGRPGPRRRPGGGPGHAAAVLASGRQHGKAGQSGTALLADLLVASFKSRAGSLGPLMASAKARRGAAGAARGGVRPGQRPEPRHRRRHRRVGRRRSGGGRVGAGVRRRCRPWRPTSSRCCPTTSPCSTRTRSGTCCRGSPAGAGRSTPAMPLRVGVFTDTAPTPRTGDGGRFLRELAAHALGTAARSSSTPAAAAAAGADPARPVASFKDFQPLVGGRCRRGSAGGS